MSDTPAAPIPILLLAAGRSRRMQGRDKLLEPVDGQPLLRRTVLRALQAGPGPVLVALPPAPHPRHDALAGLTGPDAARLLPVPVPDRDDGMNVSLRTALARVPPGSPAAMILLADLPDLTADDLRHMLDTARADIAATSAGTPAPLIWRATTEDGKPGHPVLFAAPLFARLAALDGDGGAAAIVRAHTSRLRDIPLPGQRARTDLDTPEAWAAWREARDS